MVNYIAGIIAVPGELLEAARIDGATSFQVFRKITIPMIMPAISICMLTSMTFAFKLFDIIMVFTKGGPANSFLTDIPTMIIIRKSAAEIPTAAPL